MLKTLRNLYERYFGVAESAALISGTPAYYYEIFQAGRSETNPWMFTWYGENHSSGATIGYPTRDLALLARNKWLADAKDKGYITVPVSA